MVSIPGLPPASTISSPCSPLHLKCSLHVYKLKTLSLYTQNLSTSQAVLSAGMLFLCLENQLVLQSPAQCHAYKVLLDAFGGPLHHPSRLDTVQ